MGFHPWLLFTGFFYLLLFSTYFFLIDKNLMKKKNLNFKNQVTCEGVFYHHK
jgi:hypothetical protein